MGVSVFLFCLGGAAEEAQSGAQDPAGGPPQHSRHSPSCAQGAALTRGSRAGESRGRVRVSLGL